MLNRADMLSLYTRVRETTMDLVSPLPPEDFRIQTMPDVSPPWWMLGHTTWFFARVLLRQWGDYGPRDEGLDYLLNSYYHSLGHRLPRDRRGSISCPTNADIFDYRRDVDTRMTKMIASVDDATFESLASFLEVGCHHEQQHQELFVTEIKHILNANPQPYQRPYRGVVQQPRPEEALPAIWLPVPGGTIAIGHQGAGFCWDNELGVHDFVVQDFELQNRLVTNGEYLEFMEDGGYDNPLLWLSNGWDARQRENWRMPLYWYHQDGHRRQWTLGGMMPQNDAEPVCHLSFYEADAFARWKGETFDAFRGARLPREQEWEHGARHYNISVATGNLLDSGRFHPRVARGEGLRQMLGDVWEWTASHYEPYPRYQPFDGALVEYNGKFMDNQRVLRGGSFATPMDHIRISYRNFWAPETRFQATGIRLARYV